MADSNFFDYVKILCRSGKGGAGSRHFYRANMYLKAAPTAAMEVVEATLSLKETKICGLCFR